MDLYHLKTFVRVAHLQSFTRAAEELALSQSAVSRHIEALEREFGMELFARHGRGAGPTVAGARLLQYAESLLRMAQEANRALAELRDLDKGQLSIGACTTAGNYIIGPAVALFQERYPGIDVSLSIRESKRIQAMVEEGLVDVAMLPEIPLSTDVITEPCLPDEILPVVGPDHPLARRGELRPEDLASLRLYIREAGSHTRSMVEQWMAEHGIAPRDLQELGSTEAIKQAVAAGGGISFCSRHAVALERRSGVLTVLGGPGLPLTRQFVFAFPKGGRRPPAAMAFSAFVRKMRPQLEARAAVVL